MTRRAPASLVSTFVDRYGDNRVVHRNPNGKLAVRRDRQTVSLALTKAVGRYIGTRVQELRIAKGWTGLQLATRAGIVGGKQRIYSIENSYDGAMRMGTLYALAIALGVGVSDLLPATDWALREAEALLGPVESVHLRAEET